MLKAAVIILAVVLAYAGIFSLTGFMIIDYIKIGFYKLLDHADIKFSR